MFKKDNVVLYNLIVFALSILIVMFSSLSGVMLYHSICSVAPFFSNDNIAFFSSIMVNCTIIVLLLILFFLYRYQKNFHATLVLTESGGEREIQNETVQMMLKALETHDPYTKCHSESVARLSSEFAAYLGISDEKRKDIYLAGMVHDLGKLLIPTSILNKPARLSGSEFEIIKRHPMYAFDIFKDSKAMKDVALYIKYHHEWFDGRGYPENLSGEEIPFESRLLSLVDSWDAMTSDRIYQKGISKDEALIVLKENAGTQFDPILVEKWIKFLLEKDTNQYR
jgi:HD-GYP domain-containing protein (c-di-GMP phosphodiesterase class II)